MNNDDDGDFSYYNRDIELNVQLNQISFDSPRSYIHFCNFSCVPSDQG